MPRAVIQLRQEETKTDDILTQDVCSITWVSNEFNEIIQKA
jgi:hypothetical protein